jgi:REP element-mobilizing transposase RayT
MGASFSVLKSMARKIRYVQKSQTLVHITCRTIQGRYLFRPGPQFNDLFLGILGKAQRDCGVGINAIVALSSHFHLLLTVDDAKQVAGFMRNVSSKLALEVNRLTGWRGTVFGCRYKMANVTDEELAQVGVFKYVLSQSVKEQLVERLQDWPGVHCIQALLEGALLTGHWFNRSQEHAARIRGEEYGRLQYATAEAVILTPIPCWAHLSAEEYRRRVASLQEDIEAEAAAVRRETGAQVLGVEAILSRDPLYHPEKLARSPAPLVHAATQAACKAFYEAYSWFLGAFRDAAEKLRRGDRTARFPAGSFPPALPFVPG